MHFEDAADADWEDIVCYLPNLKSIAIRIHCRGSTLENIAKFCRDI